MATTSETTSNDFGTNQWLVEDMYERYQADPASVDAAWHDFFADYRPPGARSKPASNGSSANGATNGSAPAVASQPNPAPATPTPAAPTPATQAAPVVKAEVAAPAFVA